MRNRRSPLGLLAAVLLATLIAACQPSTSTSAPGGDPEANRARLRDILAEPGVTYLAVNEICRCVHIGAADDAADQQVRQFVSAAGVPLDQVQIVRRGPFRQQWNLQDSIRPIKGGLRIQNTDYVQCTMFATVYHKLLQKKGLLTNAHCSRRQFALDEIEFYQPGGVPFSGDFVARETIDAEGFTLPADRPSASRTTPPGPDRCPVGHTCRKSDAVFARFDTSTVGIVGRLARPAGRCGDGSACTRDLAGNDPNAFLQIAGTGKASVGTVVDKIGWRTGWTFGKVSETCADVSVVDDAGKPLNITLLCQTLVDGKSDKGDSGSPAFIWDGGDGATLVGILWGGVGDGFVYSPLDQVEEELGEFAYRE